MITFLRKDYLPLNSTCKGCLRFYSSMYYLLNVNDFINSKCMTLLNICRLSCIIQLPDVNTT